MTILLGADPELFVKDVNSNSFISAHDMVEGTKENPLRVHNGAVQVDGMALEFNIDPTDCPKQFAKRIRSVRRQLTEMIGKDKRLHSKATVHFDAEYMAGLPEKALELGCEPDFNAYTGEANPRPDGAKTFRTGAGHIHIGWTEGKDPHDPSHFNDCRFITQVLDQILLPASKVWDKDEERRQLYGAKGAFRPKPYGVEYRVLSNAWLKNAEITEYVAALVKNVVERIQRGNVGALANYEVYRELYLYHDFATDLPWKVYASTPIIHVEVNL